MKVISLIVVFLNLTLYATPTWFYNISSKSYEIIGYGIDKDLQIARDMAKGEVAKTIKIKISSDTNVKKSLLNNSFNKSIKTNLTTKADATLQGIKIIKEEQYIDGNWYVAVIYDDRTIIQKINVKYPKFKESNLKDIANIDVIRKNNGWYLKINNDLYLLSTQNFQQIFSNIDNKDLIFKSNKTKYISYDKMQFQITSKEKGYISILYSEVNGKVGVVLSNQKISKELVYPKQNDENQLIAYNPTKNTIAELYICIYSKDRLDLREFENIGENLLDESNYNFNKLLDIIKNNKFSSIKIKIKNEG